MHRQYNKSIDSEDQKQGFEVQKIKIINHQLNFQQKNKHLSQFSLNHQFQKQRPVDFLPRSLYLNIPLKCYSSSLQQNNIKFNLNIFTHFEKTKEKIIDYSSLEQKYEQCNNYLPVYRKFGQDYYSQYLKSYLNLRQQGQFNEKHYKLFTQNPSNQYKIGFDSNFESGNLLYAYKVPDYQQFDLILQNDINTKGYTQWFYFSFKNGYKINTIKFNIVNMIKKSTLFNHQIRPLVYSQKKKHFQRIGWSDDTKSIKYFNNQIFRANNQSYYTLSFEYDFQYQNDVVFFAMNIPYTYTKLIKFLKNIQQKSHQEIIIQKKILCYTISNNALPYITIRTQYSNQKIIILARQHPGQTISSYIMENLITQILQYQSLLKKIEFIIIPMVNPDGVIYGNFRTNIAGYDLNRQWNEPNKIYHPQIYYIKKLIQSLQKVVFILDLHGHSQKFGSFTFANNMEDKIKQKLFPILMKRNTIFNIKQCTFGITHDKLKTARSTLKNLCYDNIFTFETSFFGYQKNNSIIRFSNEHYRSLARTIINSIEIYLYNTQPEEVLKSINFIKCNVKKFEEWQKDEQITKQSDSNPSEDQLSQGQRQAIKSYIKKYQRGQNKKILKKLFLITNSKYNKEVEKKKQIHTRQLSTSVPNRFLSNVSSKGRLFSRQAYQKMSSSQQNRRQKKNEQINISQNQSQKNKIYTQIKSSYKLRNDINYNKVDMKIQQTNIIGQKINPKTQIQKINICLTDQVTQKRSNNHFSNNNVLNNHSQINRRIYLKNMNEIRKHRILKRQKIQRNQILLFKEGQIQQNRTFNNRNIIYSKIDKQIRKQLKVKKQFIEEKKPIFYFSRLNN